MIQVFLDTETTGVHRGYRPWEIGLIRRADAGPDTELTIFIDVDDLDLDTADLFALQVGGFEQRHPQRGGHLGEGQLLLAGHDAAELIHSWTAGALIYGVNASYDTIGLDGLLGRHGFSPSWYYVPQDIAGIAYGYLLGAGHHSPPRSSEKLSVACGVDFPAEPDRHTALGDARWVARWYDRLCAGGHDMAVA